MAAAGNFLASSLPSGVCGDYNPFLGGILIMSLQPRTAAFIRFGIPLLLVAAAFFLESYAHREIQARQARQSVFLNSYRPDAVLKGFESRDHSQSGSSGLSRGGVVDVSEFDSSFVGRESDSPKLIAALRQDIETKLKQSGARVTGGQFGSSSFDLEYVAGGAAGRATAEVITANASASAPSLQPGEVAVRVLVRIHEGWAQRRPS